MENSIIANSNFLLSAASPDNDLEVDLPTTRFSNNDIDAPCPLPPDNDIDACSPLPPDNDFDATSPLPPDNVIDAPSLLPPDNNFDAPSPLPPDNVIDDSSPSAPNTSTEIFSLKSQISMLYQKLMGEDNVEILRRNLNIMKKFEFSNDFIIRDASKKRNVERQPDFLPQNRKLQKHYISSIDTTCLSSKNNKELNEGIVNSFLESLCMNFTYEGQRVGFTTVLGGNDRSKQHDVHFKPKNCSNKWTLVILEHGTSREFTPVCDEEWQNGYSMLIKCMQVLTKNEMDNHTSTLINKFRTMLANYFMDKSTVFDVCSRCFGISCEKTCPNCSLQFCKNCLKSGFCNRCQ